MFATSTKTATFLPTCTPWSCLVLCPAGAHTQLGGDVHGVERLAAEPAAATFLVIRGLASEKPIPCQRGKSVASGLSASTTVQPLLLADRSSSSRSAAVILSASYSGSTTRRSIVPTYPPARTEGRSASTAPPTTTRCVSATTMLACGR